MTGEELLQMNAAQLETCLADLAADLEEDRELLDRLRKGEDPSAILRLWIERAIRQSESRLHDMEQYYARLKAGMAEAGYRPATGR